MSASDGVMSQVLRDAGITVNTWGSLGDLSSMQAASGWADSCMAALDASCHRQLESIRQQFEVEQRRAREVHECQLRVASTTLAEAARRILETTSAKTQSDRLTGISESLLSREITQPSVKTLAEAAGAMNDRVAASVHSLEIDFQPITGVTRAADSINGLKSIDTRLAYTGRASDALSSLGGAARSYLDTVQDSLSHSITELRESLRTYGTQEAEKFKQYSRAVTPLLTLGKMQSSDRYSNKVKRLIARHGPQFTMQQALALEEIARKAERLLSTRNRRKITKNLALVLWGASFGSKILLSYLWLLLLVWRLLSDDLLDPPQLHKVRQSVRCLSPPPDQPLDRLPKVKPNAPNITA